MINFDLSNTCRNFQFLYIDIHRIKWLILVNFHSVTKRLKLSFVVNLRFLVLFSFKHPIGDGCLHFRLVWELVVHERARLGPQAMCSLSVIYYYSSCSCLSLTFLFSCLAFWFIIRHTLILLRYLFTKSTCFRHFDATCVAPWRNTFLSLWLDNILKLVLECHT